MVNDVRPNERRSTMARRPGDLMRWLHETAVLEYGRLAGPLDRARSAQLIHLPGGAYATVLAVPVPELVLVQQGAGTADFARRRGLAEALLVAQIWRYGRVELLDDQVAVGHALPATGLTGPALVEVVNYVHQAACALERLLRVGSA